jgi:prophage regulatory protein
MSEQPTHDRVLRWPEVLLCTGLSRPTISRLMDERQFPQRIKLGARAVGWRASEVAEWIEARQAKPLKADDAR